MLVAGGNAVDAGVASIFCRCNYSSIRMLAGAGKRPFLDPDEGWQAVHSIAGVGTMPKLATAEFFRNRPLQIGEILEQKEPNGLKGMVPVAGIMCALVPGLPDATLVALRDFGTKSFSRSRGTRARICRCYRC